MFHKIIIFASGLTIIKHNSMRPLFYLLFALSFGWMLGGCSDDKEELAAPEEEYEFREVLWMLDESKGDGMDIMEKKGSALCVGQPDICHSAFCVCDRHDSPPLCVYRAQCDGCVCGRFGVDIESANRYDKSVARRFRTVAVGHEHV